MKKPILPTIISITGNTTHVGSFTGTFEFYKAPWNQGGELMGEKISNGTIIAANGDKIYFESDDPGMVLNMPIDPFNITGIMLGWATITGGTGRFLNCSGKFFQTGTFNMSLDYAMWTVDGTITY